MHLTRNDSSLPDVVPATPTTARSMNSTFTTLQPSQLSSCTDLNTSAPKSCPQNKTPDPLQSSVSSAKAESGATDQVSSVSRSTTEASLVMNMNSSTDKTSGSSDVQAIPFDGHSLQTTDGSTVLGETGATTSYLKNSMLNAKQSGAVCVSQRSSSERHQNTVGEPSPFEVCHAISSTQENSEVHPPELPKHNRTAARSNANAKTADTTRRTAWWFDDRLFPEITLLDVTRDSEFSPGEQTSPMEGTQDFPPSDSLKKIIQYLEINGKIVKEPPRSDIIQGEELSSALTGSTTCTLDTFDEQSVKSVRENVMKAYLEVTRDMSESSVLENCRTSSEPSGQNVVKIKTSAEDTLPTHPVNVTHDMSTSSDMSAQSAASQFSASGSSNNVTSELHGEPMESCNTVEPKNEEFFSHDNNKAPQPSPKAAGSANSTFTVVHLTNLSGPTILNTTSQTPCSQKKTLDASQSNVNSAKVKSDSNEQASSVSNNTTETCLIMNQNCSAVKASSSYLVQNVCFDRHSSQKSSGSTSLGNTSSTTPCHQNTTFDCKSPSKQNGTITLSERSLNESHQKTLGMTSPSKVCNLTHNPKGSPPELSKHNETTGSTDANDKVADTQESTYEAKPPTEVASVECQESQDHSLSGLSDTLEHESVEMGNNKANTFNLDDTLDLRTDSLTASTPMINCKVLNFGSEGNVGKAIGVQKKLYGDVLNNPRSQVPSNVPPNVIGDPKIQFTSKSLLPTSKSASQLLKYKPASTLPGLPMTRQRTQAEALGSTAASGAAPKATGTSSCYNLRAATTGSKQLNSGLPRQSLIGLRSGIQRAPTGLRPPSARCCPPVSSSTDKLHGSTAAYPVMKNSQAKKHPLTREEALPTAKRQKIEAPLASGSAEALTSSYDAANRTKTLKHPTISQKSLPAKTIRDSAAVPASTAETALSCDATSRARAVKPPAISHRASLVKPQGHGCAKCVVLEEQLKMKAEEIRRLKEELLKYSRQEEEY
uniref:uncharacterized protein LOC109973636 n=1 Tax=Monopterus albus TaxID=43700 RepID=UPI0009B456F7|nr:uncharacterized protein LOC109973636 [Monopterus albus]